MDISLLIPFSRVKFALANDRCKRWPVLIHGDSGAFKCVENIQKNQAKEYPADKLTSFEIYGLSFECDELII